MSRSIRKIFSFFKYKLILLFKGGVDYAKIVGVQIGDNCRVGSVEFGSEPFLVTIGNNVTITIGVKFITHDGSGCLHSDSSGRRYYFRRIKIGNNVFIGVNSILMPGVHVCDNVIIAPGSIVTKSIPTGCIVAGVPAKIIGDYWTHENKCLTDWVHHNDFVKIKNYKERVESSLTSGYKEFLVKSE